MSGRPKGDQHHIGLLNGFAAYGMWGLVPLFWPLLKPAGAAEILAHRMVWSLAFVAVALLVIRRWAWAGELLRQPRKLGLVTIAAAFITVNWGVYIWAVNSGHVVEASLGYFINPLVTIAMGVLLLKERLRPAQWAAVGVGLAAVLVLAVGYGRPPWISLTLAFSFATYGLVKKKVNLGGIESLAAETAIQFFPALAYLLWLNSHGTLTFAQEGPGPRHPPRLHRHRHRPPPRLLRRGGDPGPAVDPRPAPVPGTGLPVPAGHPVLPRVDAPARWAGFALVWLALALLTTDAWRTARRDRATAAALRRNSAATTPTTPADPAGTTTPADTVEA